MENILQTLEEFLEKNEIYVTTAELYDGAYTDSYAYVVDNYDISEDLWSDLELLLDKCELEIDEFNWFPEDQVMIDYYKNVAYIRNDYGEDNFIIGDGEIIGRKTIEEMEQDELLQFVEDMGYINTSHRALPSWFPEIESFIEQSCEFANGWYGRNDQPEQILAKAQSDIIFKIDYVNMFETGFCVLKRED